MSSRAVWITNGTKAARVAESSLAFWQLRGWMPMAARVDVAAEPVPTEAPEPAPVAGTDAPPADKRSGRTRSHRPRRDSAETLNAEAIAPHTEE